MGLNINSAKSQIYNLLQIEWNILRVMFLYVSLSVHNLLFQREKKKVAKNLEKKKRNNDSLKHALTLSVFPFPPSLFWWIRLSGFIQMHEALNYLCAS